jgi:hypothetical protein
LEGSGGDIIEVLLLHLPGGTEEKEETSLVRIAAVQIDIRTEYFPNINLESHR